jgi:glucans biosynthesis protein C
MSNSSRIHGLDVLRGVAMTLGIFLHAAIAYKQGYHYGNWIFDKANQSYFFDWLYLWINSFRMQLFFLLAGFFSRLLIQRIGLMPFFKNRLKRIGLPFLLGYFTILPLTLLPYLYVEYAAAGKDPWIELRDFFIVFFTFRTTYGLMHMWFLQHLLVYYTMLVVTVFILGGTQVERWLGGVQRFFSREGMTPVWFLLLSTFMLAVLSQLFEARLPSIWVGLIIPVPQFLYYAFFFTLGYILERSRTLFTAFNRGYVIYLVAGTLLSFPSLYLVNAYDPALPMPGYAGIGLKALFAFQTMLLILGFIGWFNEVFREPSRFWKYIADSAYWVYLIHMPVVFTLQLLMVHSTVPGILRFPLVIIGTLIVAYSSYHYLIRFTWVGVMLNGKKPTKEEKPERVVA